MSAQVRQAAYVHGTEPSEQRRLAELNRLTNRDFVEFLQVAPGASVLEVGSGLGILAAEVAAAQPGVEVVGLERSAEQLAVATVASGVRYVQGDAQALDFPDASFDLVYCRYVLEHIGDPGQVLSEMARVLRPGGRVAVQENDISLTRLDPPCPAFHKVWSAFAEYQGRLGGDALIGRRLFRLLHSSGFRDIRLSVQPEIHWYGSSGFPAWIENLIGNARSGREGLVERSLCSASEVDEAIAELSALARRHDGSAQFVWNRATGFR